MWVLEGRRSGGCGFSAVGIRVQAGKAGDQPFSLTVRDPGSLWGNITCRRMDTEGKMTTLASGAAKAGWAEVDMLTLLTKSE